MSKPFDPEVFGEQLSIEIERAGMDVKQLQQGVRDRIGKARGTSYGSIWSYVNGQAPLEPQREVVNALAEVLDVLPGWLLFGDPPRTEREAALLAERQAREAEGEPGFERYRRIFQAMKEAEAEVPDLRMADFMGRDELLEGLVFDLMRSGTPGAEYSPEEYAEAFTLLAWLIFLPATALGVVDFLNEGRGREYFMAMATALSTAMPGPNQGYPLNTLRALRARRRWAQGDTDPGGPLTEREVEELDRDRGRHPRPRDTQGTEETDG